jgi:hypothetical protein
MMDARPMFPRPEVHIETGQGVTYEGQLRSLTRDVAVFDGEHDRYDLAFDVERVLLDRRFTDAQVALFRRAMAMIFPTLRVLHEASDVIPQPERDHAPNR